MTLVLYVSGILLSVVTPWLGVVVISEHASQNIVGQLREAEIPVVLGGRPTNSTDTTHFVDNDNLHGGRLATDREIDGVFAASELMALGAMRVLRREGRRVARGPRAVCQRLFLGQPSRHLNRGRHLDPHHPHRVHHQPFSPPSATDGKGETVVI